MADILSLAPGETDVRKIVEVVNELVRRVMPAEDAASGAAQVPVANAELAQMVEATVKGRAAGAGTGTPVDLTATQLLGVLNTLSTIGIGGTKLVILKQSDPNEGGELYLEKSSGSSLAANVVIDLNTNTFRVFEGGSSFRGFNADLTACAGGAGTSLVPGIGSEKLGEVAGLNQQTGSYTLVLSDKGKTIFMLVGSANNLTIPPDSSVAFPIGTYINVIQNGAGQTTLVPGSGVTIVSYNSALKLAGTGAMATLVKYSTDIWFAGGNLVA